MRGVGLVFLLGLVCGLGLVFADVPSNDSCENAESILEGVETFGATIGASFTPGPCDVDPFPNVFFSFTPERSDIYRFSVCPVVPEKDGKFSISFRSGSHCDPGDCFRKGGESCSEAGQLKKYFFASFFSFVPFLSNYE